MAEPMSAWQRFSHLRATLANWPLVIPDKLGIAQTCQYKSRSGLTVACRGRTPDVNEVVAVLSGLEYPSRYVNSVDGEVVVDLGANIGSFALYFDSLHPNVLYRGIAVEPFAENFVLLTRNLRANGVSKFTPHQVAISGKDGQARLRTDVPVDEIHLSDTGSGVQVTSFMLSTFCAQHAIERVGLLKMDIEGAEHDVVDADFDFLRSRVARIILECHQLGEGRTVSALLDRLKPSFQHEIVHRSSTTAIVYAQNRSWGHAARGNQG